MAGHSKWAKVKYQKAVKDPKKSKAFAKVVNLIVVATRQGGKDINSNPKLRLAIEKAKEIGMPKENIERAIQRGAGEIEGENLEELLIGAYGPGGVALLIQAITNNKNRTIGEIRHILTEHGGKMAETESVKWLFKEVGGITIPKTYKSEDLMLKLIEMGVLDIKETDLELNLYSEIPDLNKIKQFLISEMKIPEAEVKESLEFLPTQTIKCEDANLKEQLEKLFEVLDEQDDVEEIYSNLKE
jgi:YebC/PmpR family DNA-binding regulatory protein